MSRTVIVRGLGVFIALSLVVGMCMITYVAGCNSADLGSDFGAVEPGCRAPSGCFSTGIDCACNRSDVFPSAGGIAVCESACVTAESSRTCICNLDNLDAGVITRCQTPQAVCVGRAATTCEGVGARCLPKGGSCVATDPGSPPNQVGTGLHGSLEARCAYADDVCCPGQPKPADGGNDDAGRDSGTSGP